MRKSIWRTFIILCLVWGSGYHYNTLMAAGSDQDTLEIKKCEDFKITGDGLSNQWNNTEWIELDTTGKRDPSYLTKVKVLYSKEGIYFLFNCNDKKLSSTMKADNLNLWEEDVVEVFLWTDENFPVYFEYELSPLNYELPIIVPNNKGTFLGWLPWHYEGERKTRHATNVNSGKIESGNSISGWSAEFFIPYKLLVPLSNVPPVEGTKWRANLYRIDYDSGVQAFFWQKTEKTFHEYARFGTFVFR